jgi:hypothetical protein
MGADTPKQLETAEYKALISEYQQRDRTPGDGDDLGPLGPDALG